ncbi:hypothetical protein CBOM_07792 [Ceraceosorus bombacis]|uniref:Uncharacterized protein n=1 Tax=Ceraceosorus bombacis TaxID=401625 RepID=A0A0P1BPE5_9BASI|nr:hypothetical protein CBOM_07792 [Ceraceosorus bombacis]
MANLDTRKTGRHNQDSGPRHSRHVTALHIPADQTLSSRAKRSCFSACESEAEAHWVTAEGKDMEGKIKMDHEAQRNAQVAPLCPAQATQRERKPQRAADIIHQSVCACTAEFR